jgi:secondary thiamine-phosphate synthase enzyme
MLRSINIKTGSRVEFIDITDEINRVIKDSGITNGICCIYVPHTTAGIIINEGADPSVKRDIQKSLSRLIPSDGDYTHAEGNSPAHIKSSLTGISHSVIIEDGKLLLGAWQSVFFCEFDGPRSRKVMVKILG